MLWNQLVNLGLMSNMEADTSDTHRKAAPMSAITVSQDRVSLNQINILTKNDTPPGMPSALEQIFRHTRKQTCKQTEI